MDEEKNKVVPLKELIAEREAHGTPLPKLEVPSWLEQMTLMNEHLGRIANTLEFAVDNGLTVVTPADRAVASLRAQAHEMQMQLQAIEEEKTKIVT